MDEGIFPKQSLRRINNRYNLKHIKHDLNKGGIKDREVYELARKEKRIIITYNIEDFRKLASQNKDFGVIGVT